MGHIISNITIKGEEGEQALTEILVDTGATYSVLSPEVVRGVGAMKASFTTDVELGDGRKVKAAIYYALASIGDREGPAIILSFEGAKEVIGVQTLESLGLKLDPATGKLEATRPKNLAYFYSMSCSPPLSLARQIPLPRWEFPSPLDGEGQGEVGEGEE